MKTISNPSGAYGRETFEGKKPSVRALDNKVMSLAAVIHLVPRPLCVPGIYVYGISRVFLGFFRGLHPKCAAVPQSYLNF